MWPKFENDATFCWLDWRWPEAPAAVQTSRRARPEESVTMLPIAEFFSDQAAPGLSGVGEVAVAPPRHRHAPFDAGFIEQNVFDRGMAALVARNHPLASRSSIALRELKDTPFIMFEPGFSLHRIMLDASRRCGFEPTIGALSSQIEFMIELVGAGMGVAFLPRMIAEQRRHPAVDHVLLDEPSVEWSMSMAWRRNGYLSDAAQAWRSLVAEKFGDR